MYSRQNTLMEKKDLGLSEAQNPRYKLEGEFGTTGLFTSTISRAKFTYH